METAKGSGGRSGRRLLGLVGRIGILARPQRKLSQTVDFTWSNFAGHGHKQADEMSLIFWAGGKTWWSNLAIGPT